MGDDITIGVTEIVNNIEVTAQPNDQIVDISVIDNTDEVTLNITPTVIEINVNKGSSYAKWGTILGTLSDQEDLQDVLDLKANLVDGKVPASELPSYVDDVIEVANYAALPTTGEIGKIYITLDDNKIYRWSGSIYIEIASNQAIWGAITGSLTNQTDLVNALNLKANISGQVFTGAISATNLSGTNTGDQDLSGLVPNTRTLTINGTTFDLSADRTYTIPTHDAVTLGTENGLSLSGQVLSLALASGSTTGALSSTDWNTFNNKLSSLSGAVLTTTDQSITGTKTFNVSTLTDAILVNNSGGSAIRINNSTAGFGLLINNATLSSAIPLVIQKNGTTNFSVSDIGHISTASIAATTIVKSGGTAAQILAADGTVITAGTNITISGGTISASGGSTGSLEFNGTDLTVWNNGKGNFSSNTSFGDGALKNNSSGTSTTAYGNNALRDNSSGNSNTALGVGSLISNSTGSNNVAIGQSSGQTYQNISSSIFIGNSTAGSGENQTNQIVIGHNAVGNGSNTVTLGNSSIVTTILRGNVGIGGTSPLQKLDVFGTSRISNTTPTQEFYSTGNGDVWGSVYAQASGTGSGASLVFSTKRDGNTATDKMIITQLGSVGIGTTSPSYQLQLSTDSAAKPTSALWTIASDERIKENINPYTKGLNELLKINPITYDYNGLGGFEKGKGGVGIIAQEISEILPDSVSSIKGKLNETDEEEIDILNFNGHELTYILINAVKELKAEIELLKAK